MASFRVGQRVRVVKALPPLQFSVTRFVGMEGVVFNSILRSNQFPVAVKFVDDEALFMESELAPLTDPRCSEFISDMERFAKIASDKVSA